MTMKLEDYKQFGIDAYIRAKRRAARDGETIQEPKEKEETKNASDELKEAIESPKKRSKKKTKKYKGIEEDDA